MGGFEKFEGSASKIYQKPMSKLCQEQNLQHYVQLLTPCPDYLNKQYANNIIYTDHRMLICCACLVFVVIFKQPLFSLCLLFLLSSGMLLKSFSFNPR